MIEDFTHANQFLRRFLGNENDDNEDDMAEKREKSLYC